MSPLIPIPSMLPVPTKRLKGHAMKCLTERKISIFQPLYDGKHGGKSGHYIYIDICHSACKERKYINIKAVTSVTGREQQQDYLH